MYDTKKEIIYLIDKELLTRSGVYVHPNVNTATLAIQTDGFMKLLKWWGNTVIQIEIK
jgi:Ala-tRNA(Pro) deacylase